MSMMSTIVRYAPAVLIPRLSVILQMSILTHLMTKSDLGLWTLVITTGEAIDVVAINWTRISFVRFSSGTTTPPRAEFMRALKLLGVMMPLVAVLALAAGYLVQDGEWLAFANCVLLYVVANAVLRLGVSAMVVQNWNRAVVTVESLRGVLSLAAAVAVSAVAPSYLSVSIVTALVSAAAAIATTTLAVRNLDRAGAPLNPLSDVLGYGWPLIVGAVFTTVLTSADRFILDSIVGAAGVAAYASAAMLARQPLDLIFGLVNQTSFTRLIRAYETGGTSEAGRALSELLSAMLFFGLPACVGLTIVARPLAELMLAADYVDQAAYLIPLGAAAGLVAGLKNFVFDPIFHMQRRNWEIILSMLPATFIGLVCMVVLTRHLGMFGCALAFLIQHSLAMLSSLLLASRYIRFSPAWSDLAKIGTAVCLMSVVAYSAARLLASHSAPVQLAVSAAAGALTYGLVVLFFRPHLVEEIYRDRRAAA